MKNINVSAIALSLSLLVAAPVVAADTSKTVVAPTSAPAAGTSKDPVVAPPAPAPAPAPVVAPQEAPKAPVVEAPKVQAPAAPAAGEAAKTGVFTKIGNGFSSAWSSVKAFPAATWEAAKAHPYLATAAVVAVPAALYVIATNWKQIKKAVLNNPGKTAAALGLGAIALYGYNKNWFSSAATDAKAPEATKEAPKTPETSKTPEVKTPATPEATKQA